MKNIVWLKAVKVTASEFFQNTSLTGFKLFFYLQKSWILQALWIPFILCGIGAGIYISGHCLIFNALNPTVTYINTFQLQLSDVPFPSIAICSINKISGQAIKEYVNSIFKRRLSPGIDEKTLFKKFRALGGFYDHSGFDIDEAYELQIFLNKLDPASPGLFNVTEVLGMLAPKCEHMLRKCSWAGAVYPCAELFTTMPTPEGYCCVFNYNRPTLSQTLNEPPSLETYGRSLQLVGEDLGLKVLLNTSLDDYFFTKRSSLGFIVQIFNNYIFPDILGGKLREFPISPNTDILSPLVASSMSSDLRVRMFNIGQRNCYFRDEQPAEYGKYYSQQECLLRCKLQSIRALCNCVPYYTPEDLIDWRKTFRYCGLSHLECLSRYKPRWTSYRPRGKVIGLEQEMEDGLDCPNCIPLCDDYEYDYQLDISAFPESAETKNDEFLINETNLEEASLLRIFFDTPYAVEYKKRTVYSKFGLFGNIGGILSICIGCSMVCLIELVYFSTIRFSQNLKKFRMINANENVQEMEPPKYSDLE